MKSWFTIRHGLGVFFLVAFFRQGSRFFAESHSSAGGFNVSAAGSAIGIMACLVMAAILFSGKLSEVAARPFTRFIDTIYFGSFDDGSPPVTLRLARAYRREFRYRDAMEECERQLEYHPHSPDLWREVIRNAQLLGDPRELARSLRKARRQLRPEDRELLGREFSGLAG